MIRPRPMTPFQVEEPPHSPQRARQGWLGRLVAIPLFFVFTGGVAWAYWTAVRELHGLRRGRPMTHALMLPRTED